VVWVKSPANLRIRVQLRSRVACVYFFENQGESIPAKYLVSLATFDFENL